MCALGVAALAPVFAVTETITTNAHADAAPNAERLKSAAEEYDRGRRAYVANDFEQAAIHFENAYNDAPRAEALRNAIRARTQAKQLSRAATLAALAQALYASDAPTIELAGATLKEARSKLHEIKVSCTPECGVAADGRIISLADTRSFVFFLDPGAHDVTVSWSSDRSKVTHVDAKAGAHDDLTLEAPPIPVAPPPTAPPVTATPTTSPPSTSATAPPPPDVEPSRKPFGRAPFYIGAGLTAVGIGATIFSGIDAQNNPGVDAVKRDCVGQGTSCSTYQKGVNAQTRTNVILAATGGVALLTVVIGVFFTQWSDPAKKLGSVLPYVGLGQGSSTVGVSGGF